MMPIILESRGSGLVSADVAGSVICGLLEGEKSLTKTIPPMVPPAKRYGGYGYRFLGMCAALILCCSTPAAAQVRFEIMGARALGMAGAFVAVADDTTAFHWNPAGNSG